MVYLDETDDICRGGIVETFVDNGEDLENNSLMDWEPVELMEEWGNVFIFPTHINQLGSPVLNTLKTFDVR